MDASDDSGLVELLDRMADAALPLHEREQAFHALYERTAGKLYGLALRVVGNREWAEDVLQEACLHVWRTAGSYRSTLSPPLAWMGIIVRSRALDFLRRRKSERADATLELDATIEETVAGTAANPMDTQQASEAA